MKTLILAVSLALTLPAARAALTIPSDGSDGVFNPAASVEVDLSLAPTGTWDANNAANAGKGIYDAAKWAVVFKFSSINIPAGVTVTFKNHPSRAPVVWLVSGNVTIAGTVNLNGRQGTSNLSLATIPAEPGPGGFRGGAYYNSAGGGGFGPGGALLVGSGNSAYGNVRLLPLIGGSGGAGTSLGGSGGAGGGAILIAAPTVISITGGVFALGANGFFSGTAGSGGAIRVVAEQINGNGSISVFGSNANSGRIRLETSSAFTGVTSNPTTPATLVANPPVIFQATDAPTVRVISIDGVAFPAEPLAAVGNAPADQIVNKGSTPITVLVQTTNFATNGAVQVRDVGQFGPATWRPATLVAGGTYASATWSVSGVFPAGYTTLQAKATVP